MNLPKSTALCLWTFGLVWTTTIAGCQQTVREQESQRDPASESIEIQPETQLVSETTDRKPDPAKTSSAPKPLLVQQYRDTFHAKQFVENLSLPGKADDTKIYVTFGGEASTQSELPYDRVQNLCRQSLESDGWKQDAIRSFPFTEGSKYEELFFKKDGQFVSVTTSGPSSGKVDLKVKSLGNIDMRSLPAAESFELDENASFTYVGYVSNDEIDVATTFCREAMIQQGWKTFECIGQPSSLPNVQSPNQVVAFCLAGFTCYATISRTAGYKDGRTTVNYIATGIMPVDLLVLPDAENVKLDVLYGKASYHSKQDAASIRKSVSDFYTDLKFPLIDSGGKMSFVDIYRSGEGEQILVDLTPSENGTTSVQLIRQFDQPASAN